MEGPDIRSAARTSNWRRQSGSRWYLLSASRPDFGTIYYGELPHQAAFLTIPVGTDVAEKPVLFRTKSVGTISGAVRDHYGGPVERATVTATRLVWRDGKMMAESAGLAITDDRGRYRLGRLRLGAYAVCAEAGASPSTPSVLESVDASVRPEPRRYARTCYPAASPSPQSTFRVAPGQRTEVNLTLETTSPVSMRGRVVNGPPRSGVPVQLFRDESVDAWQVQSAATSPEAQTFAFHGIEPGRYRLEARIKKLDAGGVEQSLMARLSVEVGRADMEGLELTLEPAAKLGTGVSTVGLRSTGSSPAVTRWADKDKSALRLVDVAPGSYWLLTRTEEGVCVTSAKLDGREALHGKVTVTSGKLARLDVTLSGNCASVDGTVLSGGKPVPYANVLLLLSGSAADPGDLVLYTADEKGAFSLYGLSAGSYRLWAWLDDEDGAFSGPASLAAEEAKATTVVLAAGQAAKVDLTSLVVEARTQ
jgi:hypothetical protein